MEPWLSWGIILLLGGLGYYYYTSQNKPHATKARAASISEIPQAQPKASRRREDGKTKPKAQQAPGSSTTTVPRVSVDSTSGTGTGTESAVKRKDPKSQKTSATPLLSGNHKTPAASQAENDDDEDNKAWAQQLASLKKGTTLAPPTRTDSRGRTVKQSAAGTTPGFSSASSNAADADDDLTPAVSPSLGAGDVSDMLEPTSSGPSILRLTESSKPSRTTQERQQTSAQTQETKKQRQNRKKVEERRLQREAEEKERQLLLENQRRAARQARGEPAKNGIPTSKPPASSAWAAQTAARVADAPAVSTSNDRPDGNALLDTFDHDAQANVGSNAAPAKGTTTSSKSTSWDNDLLSEEDQMQMAKKLSEDESGWNTVPKGKKQKKKTQTAGSAEGNFSDNGSVHNEPLEKASVPAPTRASAPSNVPAVASAPKPSVSHSNGYLSLYDSGYDAGSHPDDSQWTA